MKKKITATVLSQKEIAPRIFDMWIATDLAEQAKSRSVHRRIPQGPEHLAAPSYQHLSGKRQKGCPAHCIPDCRTGHRGIFFLYRRRQCGDSGNLRQRLPHRGSGRQKSIPYGRRYRYPSHAGAGKRASGLRRKADHRGLP